jgi:hypothetical protein
MARALRTLTYTEPDNLSDVVKFEAEGTYSRDTVTIASGTAAMTVGTVLAKLTTGAASSAAKSGGNTGNGTLTLDVTTPVLAGAKNGIYTARCVTAAANGGTFRITDPDGYVLGDVAVAATFANDIKFVIADGASDFIVGDGFDITVAAGSGKWTLYDPTAVNGAAQAAGVLLTHAVDASAADKTEVIVLTRLAEVSALKLKWGAGVTTQGHKDIAIAQLKAIGIIARASA